MNKILKILIVLIVLIVITTIIIVINISKKDNLITPVENNQKLSVDGKVDDTKIIEVDVKADVDESKKDEEETIEVDVKADVGIEEVKEKQQIVEQNTSITTNQNNNKTESIKDVEYKEDNSNKSSTTPKESKAEVKKEESVEKPKVDERVEEVQKPVEKVEEPIDSNETPTDKVDEDYIYWSSQVDYATYQECFDAGMKEAMKDTVNILGFDCREIYYGGKILGYKLIIRYTNPLE